MIAVEIVLMSVKTLQQQIFIFYRLAIRKKHIEIQICSDIEKSKKIYRTNIFCSSVFLMQ